MLNKPEMSPIISKLLGSCVAVCIYDEDKMIGGMNHIFLPGDNKLDSSTRYGENAMKYLIKNICTLGADRDNLLAKTFGGAHVISAISKQFGVGPRIVDFVIDYLKKESIKIVEHDFGGQQDKEGLFSYRHRFGLCKTSLSR